MTTRCLGDPRLPDSRLHCPLQDQSMHVMAPDDARPWISRRLRRREDILPYPLVTGIGVFALQRIRQVDVPSTRLEILRMKLFDVVEMLL
jgi:predicted nucleic acid-binding Zn ribbon protein